MLLLKRKLFKEELFFDDDCWAVKIKGVRKNNYIIVSLIAAT